MLAATSGGPSFEVGGWVAWVIVAAALLAAAGTIYKVLWPIVRFANRFEDRWPTLEQIAVDFKGNGAGTLAQQIRRLDTNLDEVKTYAHDNNHALRNTVQEIQTRNDATVSIVRALGEAVVELKATRTAIDHAKGEAAEVVEAARVSAEQVLREAQQRREPE